MVKTLKAQPRNTRLIATERGERVTVTVPTQEFLLINATDYLLINATDKFLLGGTTDVNTIQVKTFKRNTKLIAGEKGG